MAETLVTSEGGISSAISNIRTKKGDLETQANSISAAFTELTETVQLKWVNRVITDGWNSTGGALVEGAKTTLVDLMKDLEDTAESAREISEGR